MRREVAAATIAAAIGHEPVVVCSLGSTSRAWAAIDAPNAVHFGSDPMGLAGSVALGLALAVRPRRVLWLAGDGDLTMNLEVLLAISGAPQCELAVVVFHNDRYETGGGHPLAGAGVDLGVLARGAGLRVIDAPVEPDDLTAACGRLWGEPGVAFCVLDIEMEAAPYGGPGEYSGAEARAMFQRRLRETATPTTDEAPTAGPTTSEGDP